MGVVSGVLKFVRNVFGLGVVLGVGGTLYVASKLGSDDAPEPFKPLPTPDSNFTQNHQPSSGQATSSESSIQRTLREMESWSQGKHKPQTLDKICPDPVNNPCSPPSLD